MLALFYLLCKTSAISEGMYCNYQFFQVLLRYQTWIAGTMQAQTSLCIKKLLFSVRLILLYI